MSVIPWVACNPCQPPTDYPDDDTITTTTTPAYKPLFLFLEGIDANDPTRGRDSAAPGGGGRNPSSTRLLSSRRKRRGREGSSGNWGSVVSSISRHRHRADNQQQRDPAPRPFPKVPRTTGKPMAALSLRPLEVVVYASLSFRNLLPVGMGWRVAGERGDPGARVAEGWLGPGEGVHVLEANCMAMTPSLSFKVRCLARVVIPSCLYARVRHRLCSTVLAFQMVGQMGVVNPRVTKCGSVRVCRICKMEFEQERRCMNLPAEVTQILCSCPNAIVSLLCLVNKDWAVSFPVIVVCEVECFILTLQLHPTAVQHDARNQIVLLHRSEPSSREEDTNGTAEESSVKKIRLFSEQHDVVFFADCRFRLVAAAASRRRRAPAADAWHRCRRCGQQPRRRKCRQRGE